MKNLKLYRKVAALSLACALTTTSLTGCSMRYTDAPDTNYKCLLGGTILEDTYVTTFEDGRKDIVKLVCTCNKNIHTIYYSVISGDYYSDDDCFDYGLAFRKADGSGIARKEILGKENVVSVQSISCYLSEEDLIKAANGELTKEDIIDIITRTVKLEEEVKESNEESKEESKEDKSKIRIKLITDYNPLVF